jgi:hypothetical protein
LIGSPSVNAVPEREIDSFLAPAIQFLAGYLKFAVVTDNQVPLVAEQRTYVIPADLLYWVWIDVNNRLLEPASVWSLNSGASTTQSTGTPGVNWMSVPSGTPARYAQQGRELVIYPPASADFIAGLPSPTLSWRYIGAGAYFTQDSTMGLTAQGLPSLTDLDLQVVRFDAAKAWLSAHMLGQDQNGIAATQAQIAAFEKEIATRLPECKRRAEENILDSTRTMRPDCSQRYTAAR